MESIDILKKEHQNILYFIEEVRRTCIEILDGKPLDVKLFYEYLEFGRYYADRHHHKKEEDILFYIMMEELGEIAEKLIRYGMLVEHDLGRLHLLELETALKEYEVNPSTELKLDILSLITGYGFLLKRHIDKEDNTIYPFAERMLNEESKDIINKESQLFENREAESINAKFRKWIVN